jgi:hypothetical protein
LFTLALMAGEDSLARKVVARRLALATDANERQVILAEAVAGYVAAEPARLSDAEWAVVKADTLAVHDHTNSLPAHEPLMDAARRAFDRPRLLKEAHTIIALGNTLDFKAIQYKDVPVIAAWMQVLTVAFFDQPDSVLALAQAAKNDLRRFPAGFGAFPNGVRYTSEQLFDFKTATVEKVRNFLLPFNPQQYGGTRALPPVVASYWFPEAPKTWPPKGAISLVIYGGEGMACARTNWNLLDLPLSYACVPWHTYLPKWAAQYDSLGFSLTIVEHTYGHAVRSVVLSPSSEADSLNWYYRTYLKLPATMAVVSQSASVEPDGRHWFADTTAFGRFLGPNHGRALLFDRDGTLLYAGENWLRDHALLDALILRATHASNMNHGKEIN